MPHLLDTLGRGLNPQGSKEPTPLACCSSHRLESGACSSSRLPLHIDGSTVMAHGSGPAPMALLDIIPWGLGGDSAPIAGPCQDPKGPLGLLWSLGGGSYVPTALVLGIPAELAPCRCHQYLPLVPTRKVLIRPHLGPFEPQVRWPRNATLEFGEQSLEVALGSKPPGPVGDLQPTDNLDLSIETLLTSSPWHSESLLGMTALNISEMFLSHSVMALMNSICLVYVYKKSYHEASFSYS